MVSLQIQYPIEQNSPICEHASNSKRMKSEETPDPKEALQESRERNLEEESPALAVADKLHAKESRSRQRKKMMKKTKSGQPLMKYRIEKILSQI